MGKKLALDLGVKRTGIAISDMTNTLARGLETYVMRTEEEDLQYFQRVIEENGVEEVVIGLPVNLDGTEGERALYSREMGEKLQSMVAAKITYLDERMTTAVAERYLLEADVSRKKRKTVIDKLAATIILQNYLDMKK